MLNIIRTNDEIKSKIQELAYEEEFIDYDEANGVIFNKTKFANTMNDFVKWLSCDKENIEHDDDYNEEGDIDDKNQYDYYNPDYDSDYNPADRNEGAMG
jgi:hypothetical protein